MAIFNSIVIGKASGKIGNVVLCSLKGQNVAKSRNYSPTNPRTVLQTNSRARMSNAVKAWQFLSIFLVQINALRKSTESNYNAFIRLSKNLFSDTVATSNVEAVNQLHGKSLGSSNLVNLVSCTFNDLDLNVLFSTGGATFIPDLILRVINYDPVTGEYVILNQSVSTQDFHNGGITIDGGAALGHSVGIYMFSSSENKCSNILF